jgi:hypothetical protein
VQVTSRSVQLSMRCRMYWPYHLLVLTLQVVQAGLRKAAIYLSEDGRELSIRSAVRCCEVQLCEFWAMAALLRQHTSPMRGVVLN